MDNLQPQNKNADPKNENNNLDSLVALWNFMYNNPNIILYGGAGLVLLAIGIKIDKKKQLGGSHE